MARDTRAITLDCDRQDDNQFSYTRCIDQLSKLVRTLYCICVTEFTGKTGYGSEHMLAWDGDPEGISGRRTKSVWPKIAETIIRCNAEPFEFIRAQFYCIRRDKPPSPNQIFNDAAIAAWENYRVSAKIALKQRIESDLNQIQGHVLPFIVNLKWDRTQALNYVLRDQTCGASALVRYCHGVAASLPIAAAFRERALLQYVFQMSDYDEVLGSQIPQELKDTATTFRQSIVGH